MKQRHQEKHQWPVRAEDATLKPQQRAGRTHSVAGSNGRLRAGSCGKAVAHCTWQCSPARCQLRGQWNLTWLSSKTHRKQQKAIFKEEKTLPRWYKKTALTSNHKPWSTFARTISPTLKGTVLRGDTDWPGAEQSRSSSRRCRRGRAATAASAEARPCGAGPGAAGSTGGNPVEWRGREAKGKGGLSQFSFCIYWGLVSRLRGTWREQEMNGGGSQAANRGWARPGTAGGRQAPERHGEPASGMRLRETHRKRGCGSQREGSVPPFFLF